MRVSRATALHLLLICLAVLLIITPGSAWLDHFDTDTSGSYTYDTTWVWVTASSYLRNTNAPWTGSTYYMDDTFGSGNYSVEMTRNDANPIIVLLYADVDATLGDPESHGTHYAIFGAPVLGYVALKKIIAGVPSVIDIQALSNADHVYNVTWDSITGSHKIYIDNVLTIDETDSSIMDPGYVGIASTSGNWFHCDWLSVEEAVPSTPTPTPTPTEGPVVPVELGHFNANLTANITHLHREDVYHPVEIPLWFWATIMGAGIGALLFSLVWRGAVNITVISGWVAFLLVEVAQWTAFMIRDTTVISSVVNSTATDALNLSVWVAYQPVTVATDWIVPFWGAFPFTILAIMNVMALGMELGWPGLRHLKPGIFRR